MGWCRRRLTGLSLMAGGVFDCMQRDRTGLHNVDVY